MNIRNITNSDIIQVLRIYKPFITGSGVTFETSIPAIEEFEKRIDAYTMFFPWIVADDNGVIAGYAYASKYRERVAYQWVAEVSIYMNPGYTKQGIAAKLYKALFEILQLQGIYKVYAVITIPNNESIGFHEKMGFKWFATYKNVGYKNGKWHDVGWWEYNLQDAVDNPQAPLLYPELEPLKVAEIFAKYSW